MGWLSGIAGKIIVGALSLAIVLAAISWWQADPAARSAAINLLGRVSYWILIVATLPWACYFLIGWVARKQSNAAGLALVGGLTLLEALWLAWLFDLRAGTRANWTLATAAVLIAAVYNTFTCDWLAERMET